MSARTGRDTRAELSITYTIVDSPVGMLLVGVTDKGVCSVEMGDTEEAALEAAVIEFPSAEWVRDDRAVAAEAAVVAKLAAGEKLLATVPLDLIGTEFQRRVWTELTKIPRGKTASYSEIASKIGEPAASRAVAGACAANHVAVVVPCHRVVRADGGLGGFRGGVERKRQLLASEQRAD